jgi:hypothetical protein
MSAKSIYLLAVVASIACAPAATTTGGVHREANLITQDEISASTGSTAYDVVSKLRPNFLMARGTGSMYTANDYAKVYLDGQSYGTLSSLRSIVLSQVREVRFYPGTEAVTKFGTDAGGGVIDVRTK